VNSSTKILPLLMIMAAVTFTVALRADDLQSLCDSLQNVTVSTGPIVGPCVERLPYGFAEFFQKYVRDHASNNPWEMADNFAQRSYNCYANCRVSRSFIAEDVGKLIQKYPQRTYTDVRIINVNVISPSLVRLQFRFNYFYSGYRTASGTSTEDLKVALISGRWQITSFEEEVDRR
jgi:hypothetical protein